MACPEPFRALLEKALQADTHVVRLAPPVPSMSPAPVLDVEHQRPTLEQRLDAAVLAAGATPPHGLKAPKTASKSMVPLRLAAPLAPSSSRLGDDRASPQPRMMRFLLDETIGAAGADDSVSAMPRLEPVLDSGVMAVAVGVSTNVYRLGSLIDEMTPSRPLPVQGLDDVAELETRLRKRADKVMSLKKLDGLGVSLRSFSINDTALDDLTVEGDSDSDSGRSSHAAAALALPALSDEGSLDFDGVDDIDLAAAGLDELARQLGLEGLVPRAASPVRADDSLDGFGVVHADDGEYHEVDADDVELVAVTTPANPMRAIVIARPVVPLDDVDALEGDDDHDAELAADFEDDGLSLASAVDDDYTPHGTPRLPASLLAGLSAAAVGFDDDEITPPLGTLSLRHRPSLEAPSAVRFVVAEAPARPRKEALSAREIARNRLRARDLYLIALDDIAGKDARSAMVHLQLALAYDDETPLYHDLLAQLGRTLDKREAVEG